MARMTDHTGGSDAVLLLQFIDRLLAERVVAGLGTAGFDDIRESDGYVFQHIVDGPRPVSELAARLGITQQGASKAVADLERRGYVVRRPDEHDARIRSVELTDRGRAVIEFNRRQRAKLNALIDRTLGPRAVSFRRDLTTLGDRLGVAVAVAERRLRPPR
jgi:DNA-binding MarR family transcriptional regulator